MTDKILAGNQRGGANRKLTAAALEAAIAEIMLGQTRRSVAHKLGVAPNYFHRYLKGARK
jgi:hypothetical protein